MARPNKFAAEAVQEVGARACTDVTGFGLLGHAFEMIQGTGRGIIIYASRVPLFHEAVGFAEMGLVPGGTYRNRDFRIHQVDIDPEVSRYLSDIFFDPQTSGGLLIAAPEKKAEKLVARLREEGMGEVAIIGEVVADPQERINISQIVA